METKSKKICFSKCAKIFYVYLLQEAEKSLRFYRNISPKAPSSENKSFEHELSKLKYSYTEMQRKDTDNSVNTPLCLRDFFNRPFQVGCVLMIAHEVCGAFTMCNYAGMIFAKSGSTMSPTISSIIVGAIQFLGSYVSTVLVDRLGRKVWNQFFCFWIHIKKKTTTKFDIFLFSNSF